MIPMRKLCKQSLCYLSATVSQYSNLLSKKGEIMFLIHLFSFGIKDTDRPGWLTYFHSFAFPIITITVIKVHF